MGDDVAVPPSSSTDDVLRAAAEAALAYAAAVDRRPAWPPQSAVAGLEAFDEALPDGPTDAAATLAMLDRVGSPATVASTGSDYYGFVTGAAHPAAVAASMLAAAWDQNAALPVMSPVASRLHQVTCGWLVDLLGLPTDTEVVYVTGATVANATCLAAARDALLAEHDWDVQRDGLFGAPPIEVVVGESAHSTLRKSLGLVGLGRERLTVVPADDQGRLLADRLPTGTTGRPTLVCAQAGEVNTGAFDPFEAIAEWTAGRNGWLHVDGAFGLWALADPNCNSLTSGLARADSLATDAHKWLNVTYDCGIAFVRRPGALRRTFAATAGYLPPDDVFEPMHHTPQSSQRARQVEVWAVLRTLGRSGVAELIRQSCDAARVIADRLGAAGFEVLNDVVLNQVLVRLVDGPTTERLLAAIQADGRIWCGPTTWRGETAMRVSVSSWKTTTADGERAAEVIVELARRLG